MVLIQTVVAILALSVTSRADDVTIGRGYFLPQEDIYSPLIGGMPLFDYLDGSCYKWEARHVNTDDRSTYEDTSRFYHSVASDSALSVTLTGAYTMGTTLNVKTKGVSSGSSDISGTSLDVRRYVNVSYLDQNCFKSSKSHLSQDIVSMFDTLNSTIYQPWYPESWFHYETFLKTFGSHFLIKSSLGAIVRQWTFAKNTTSYTDNQLKVRACVDFAGTTEVGKLNISACSGVSKEDAEASTTMDTSRHLDIRGGSDQAQDQFRLTRSQADLNRILEEGRRTQSPVEYAYVAVWDIMMMKFYNDSVRFAKAMTMMHYYHGFKDFGCSYLKSGNLVMRSFMYSDDTTEDTPRFECILVNRGCQVDSDCHIGGAGTVTYCYGNSCFEYQDPPFGVKAKEVIIRVTSSGHHYEGLNLSCDYKDAFQARCHTEYFPQSVIWSGEAQTMAAMAKAKQYRAQFGSPVEVPPAKHKQQNIEL